MATAETPMEEIPLCHDDEVAPFVITQQPAIARENPHHSLPIKTEPNAYLEMADIRELCEATWKLLGMEFSIGRDANNVSYEWVKRAKIHGMARQSMIEDEVLEAERQAPKSYMDYAGRGPQRVRFKLEFSKLVFERVSVSARVQTIIHEACHIAAFYKWPGQNVGHGPRWCNLMTECGAQCDAKAQEHAAGLYAIITCPSCKKVSPALPSLIVSFERGGSGSCLKCGTNVTIENIEIPESYKKKVDAARRKTITYDCQCGKQYTGLSQKMVEAIKRGSGRCVKCRAGLSVDRVRIGGQEWNAPLQGLTRGNPADITDTPAFRRWFGSSKVVDSEGRPLIVYSGRPDVRGVFGVSREPGFRTSHMRGDAFFATDDLATANSYADGHRAFDFRNAEPGVIPLFLSIENPLLVDGEFKHWRGTEHTIEQAREAGHDGVIIRNVIDHYASKRGAPPRKKDASTTYVFFKPTQAKSALTGPMKSRIDGITLEFTGPNSGAFDPHDANIRNPGEPDIDKRLLKYADLPPDPERGDPKHQLGAHASVGTYWTVAVKVPLCELDSLDPVVQDESRVYSVMNAIASGKTLPPIEVAVYHNGSAWIVDGNHRLIEARRFPRRTINTVFTFPDRKRR